MIALVGNPWGFTLSPPTAVSIAGSSSP